MKALKFDIYGKYAFFKNPENNIGTEFSFEHIHKPAILGILGAVLGLKGKDCTNKDNPYPEYYQVLKDIKVSLIPNKIVFNNFKETTTNTTGFANKDGGTQVLHRKILQNVRMTIYVLQNNVNDKYWSKLVDLLSKHESTYPLYLGNNSYKAQVDNVSIVELSKLEDVEEVVIDSIFNKSIIKEKYNYTKNDMMIPYDLMMYSPIDINELMLYKYDWLELTNLIIDVKDNVNLYISNDNILYFI